MKGELQNEGQGDENPSNEMGPTGSKWSSLNAIGTEIPESPLFEVHFPIFVFQ